MEKYSRGRRGAPAKGVDGIYPVREFKSLLLRQKQRDVTKWHPFVFAEKATRCRAPRIAKQLRRADACRNKGEKRTLAST